METFHIDAPQTIGDTGDPSVVRKNIIRPDQNKASEPPNLPSARGSDGQSCLYFGEVSGEFTANLDSTARRTSHGLVGPSNFGLPPFLNCVLLDGSESDGTTGTLATECTLGTWP